jgi:hypothetical protein
VVVEKFRVRLAVNKQTALISETEICTRNLIKLNEVWLGKYHIKVFRQVFRYGEMKIEWLQNPKHISVNNRTV